MWYLLGDLCSCQTIDGTAQGSRVCGWDSGHPNLVPATPRTAGWLWASQPLGFSCTSCKMGLLLSALWPTHFTQTCVRGTG